MLSIHQWLDIWALSAFGTLNNTTMNIWVEESVYFFSVLLGIDLEIAGPCDEMLTFSSFLQPLTIL